MCAAFCEIILMMSQYKLTVIRKLCKMPALAQISLVNEKLITEAKKRFLLAVLTDLCPVANLINATIMNVCFMHCSYRPLGLDGEASNQFVGD